MIVCFTVLVYICATQAITDAACIWPADFASSTWADSLKGEMVFTTTAMSGWSFNVNVQATSSVQVLDRWECVTYNESGPFLVMKTTDTFIQFVTEQYTGYRCIQLEKITEYSYRYYQTEPIQPALSNERMFIDTSDSLTDIQTLCQFQLTGSDFQVMIKTANAVSAAVTCPYSLLADYTFTYTKSDGTVTCDPATDEGSLNMCSNHTQLTLQNTPTCSPYPFYSSASTVWCVDVVVVGSDTFVSLYNGEQTTSIDGTTTYQFACVGINSEGTSLSVTPQHCKADQSPTEVPSDNSGNSVGAVWSLTINGAPCPPLSAPYRGGVNTTTNGAITTVTYSCEDNYTLSGNGTRTCQDDGTWSDSEPSCSCPIPSNPSHGSVLMADGVLTAMFSCDVSYTLVGTSTLTCNTDTNLWSNSYPTCGECQALPSVTNGSYAVTSTASTSVVTYSCDSGSTLNGDTTRTCNSDKTWTGTAPTCTFCPTLSIIASGNVTLSTDTTITTAVYNCSIGYTLLGDNTTTCTTSGAWDSTPPTCICINPVTPDNGTLTISVDKTTADYTCDLGFTMQGTDTRVCQSDGTGWSNKDIVCVECPAVNPPTNGSVLLSTTDTVTLATYSCDVGFSMDGDVTSQCQTDRTMSTIAPLCSQCDVLSAISSGTSTLISDGSTTSAKYTCNVGTTIRGDVIVTCDANGKWFTSATNTSCVECDDLSTVPGGSYTLSSNGTASTAELSCPSGYTLEGDPTVACQSNGSWTPSASVQHQCVSIVSSVVSTGSPSEGRTESANSLLPAVIVLAIFAVLLSAAFIGAVLYICKLKKGNREDKHPKSNTNGVPPNMFPSAKAPVDHQQHVMDFRNTSSAMSAPMSHLPSPRLDSVTPMTSLRSLKSTLSSGSLHLSHLDLIRDNTSSVIFDRDQPAPWNTNKKPDGTRKLNTDSTRIFSPIAELTSPRGSEGGEHYRTKGKKRSFSKKMQTSVNTVGDTDAVSNEHIEKISVKLGSAKPTPRPRILNRNTSFPNSMDSKGKDIVSGNTNMIVPMLHLSEQPERTSTPVKHQFKVSDTEVSLTPRSNTIATVQ